MKMKRESMFEGYIRENGELELVITYAAVGNWMPVDFWKRLIKIFGDEGKRDERIKGDDLVRLKQVVDLLKQGVAYQEKLEQDHGVGLPYWPRKLRQKERKWEEEKW